MFQTCLTLALSTKQNKKNKEKQLRFLCVLFVRCVLFFLFFFVETILREKQAVEEKTLIKQKSNFIKKKHVSLNPPSKEIVEISEIKTKKKNIAKVTQK